MCSFQPREVYNTNQVICTKKAFKNNNNHHTPFRQEFIMQINLFTLHKSWIHATDISVPKRRPERHTDYSVLSFSRICNNTFSMEKDKLLKVSQFSLADVHVCFNLSI